MRRKRSLNTQHAVKSAETAITRRNAGQVLRSVELLNHIDEAGFTQGKRPRQRHSAEREKKVRAYRKGEHS